MKILIEIPHPARVHLFKNVYHALIRAGNDVSVIYIDKDLTEYLLNVYSIRCVKVGVNKNGLFRKIIEFFIQFKNTFIMGFSFKPDLLLGGASPVLGILSFCLNKPYISFSDTEHASLTWFLTKPFISMIITPNCFLNYLGKKHIKIEGYKELAYLHPNYFFPNTKVLEYLDVKEDEKFSVIRFISWNAVHDIGHSGLSLQIKNQAVKEIEKYGKVFISAEGDLPKDLEKYHLNIPPEMMHDVLYYASLYFGESGTMATEAAILGTPSVRVSTLAKLLGNFKELNERYGLVYYYDDGEDGLLKCIEILKDENSKNIWKNKAKIMLKDKIDVTNYLMEQIIKKDNHG